MSLRIRNGTVVTARGRFQADVTCRKGRIAAIESHSHGYQVDDEIDATGLLLFPGFIDPHVHSRDPGLTEKEDFSHMTSAAAAGGVTTILEMPNTVPPLAYGRDVQDRVAYHLPKAFVDFGLWGMCLGAENTVEIPRLIDEGVVGVKLFWAYALDRASQSLVYASSTESSDSLIPPPTSGDVLRIFETVARCGGLLAAHCEDRGVLDVAAQSIGGRIDSYEDLLLSRPDGAESTAIAMGIEFSRMTGCRFHVLHVSSARGVDLLRSAKRDTITVSAETCPHYLLLTAEELKARGAAPKWYPPVRHEADQFAIREAINDGTIESISSDHAPHAVAEKMTSLGDQPAGNVGVETLVPVMMSAVSDGVLSPERAAWLLSESNARIYGLYPQKGSVLPGSDADFTLVDPNAEWEIRNDRLHSKQPLSPWNRHKGKGAPVATILRGRIVMRTGQPVSEPSGAFVRPRTGLKD